MIWATIGPSSYNKIKRLEKAGVDVFRLNLSHVDNLEKRIREIQKVSDLPICIDTDSGKYTNGVLNKDIESYCLTDADKLQIGMAERFGIKIVALSFANIADVYYLRDNYPQLELISKIEHLTGLRYIKKIAEVSQGLLIDRGDLSRSVDRVKIPVIQKNILNDYSNVYVATNLVDSMMAPFTLGQPSAGEINDIWNTLLDGAAGLVLAAETAIGQKPIESVVEVKRIIDEWRLYNHKKGDNYGNN